MSAVSPRRQVAAADGPGRDDAAAGGDHHRPGRGPAGADFVFSAIRVGGLAGRIADERVALDLGVLGQETTGPGGLAYGLRTVPSRVHVAERVARASPPTRGSSTSPTRPA